MAKRPCARAGCANVVDRGYCPEHSSAAPAALHDRRRGSSSKRGYGGRWQHYRKAYLRAHPICVDPGRLHPDRQELTTDVDHKTPVSGPDDPLFWDSSNHQPLCHSCHGHKTAKEDGGFGMVGGGVGGG